MAQKLPRVIWPARIKRELSAFYGGKTCAVTEASAGVQIDWHHLDDVRSHSVFVNGIPLRADLNEALERIREKPTAHLPIELHEEVLAITAQKHFHRGIHPLGYACSRLGSQIAWEKQDDPSAAIAHASNALLHVRAVGNIELATDTLKRCVNEILGSELGRISSLALANLSLAIAAFAFDYNAAPRGSSYLLAARALLDGEEDTVVIRRARARLGLRLALQDFAAGDHEGASRGAAESRDGSLRSGYENANVDAWQFIIAVAAGWRVRASDARRRLLKTLGRMTELSIRPGILLAGTTWWTFGEVLLALADYRRMKAESSNDSIAYVDRARDLFRSTGIRPTLGWRCESLDGVEADLRAALRLQRRSESELGPEFWHEAEAVRLRLDSALGRKEVALSTAPHGRSVR